MRRFLLIASILSRGRPAFMYLWSIVASVCVYLIALSVLTPLLGAVESARADDDGVGSVSVPSSEPVAPRASPNFSVAVGTNDRPQEMPAIQSAMTDYLSFSDEFFAQLKQGAVAPDFATHEREVSPAMAREQVEDGTAVLAVIMPKDLTVDVLRDIQAYSKGGVGAPRYTIKLLASPQSLDDDRFILRQYRNQVIRQAGEHVSEQIRTVARKLGCAESHSKCPRSQTDIERAFESPFNFTVEKLDGPTPVDYFNDEPGKEKQNPGGSAITESALTPPAPQHSGPSITTKLSAIFIALIFAAVMLAMTSSIMVNRAAGLHLVMIGPWRSLQPQRPFPRRTLLEQKYGLAAAGTVVITALSGVSALWPGSNIAEGFGTHPILRMIAVVGFFCLVCLTVSVTIIAVSDTVGSLFGAAVGLGVVLWGMVENVLMRVVDPDSAGRWLVTELLVGASSRVGTDFVATVVVLAVIVATAFVGSRSVTRAFDRKISTQINRTTG